MAFFFSIGIWSLFYFLDSINFNLWPKHVRFNLTPLVHLYLMVLVQFSDGWNLILEEALIFERGCLKAGEEWVEANLLGVLCVQMVLCISQV